MLSLKDIKVIGGSFEKFLPPWSATFKSKSMMQHIAGTTFIKGCVFLILPKVGV